MKHITIYVLPSDKKGVIKNMEEKLKVAYYSGVIEATETLVEGFKKSTGRKDEPAVS